MSFIVKFAKFADDIWKNHKTSILTGISVTGIITLPVLSGIETYDAIQLVEEEKKRLGRDLTREEIIKLTWKCYIPTGAGMLLASAASIKSNNDSMKKSSELLSGYLLNEARDRVYRSKTVEKIGPDAEMEIYKESLKASAQEVLALPAPYEKFWTKDKILGQEFWSTVQQIESAKNECNDNLIDQKEDCVSYSDWIVKCGGKPCDIPIGWRADGPLIDLTIVSEIDENKRPILVIKHKFGHEPRFGYDDIL